MNEVYYWWTGVYGDFPPGGPYNLPHAGSVIRHYANLSGMTIEEQAEKIDCNTRYMKILRSAGNISDPQTFSRRILLSTAFKIPPVLFGLWAMTTGESSVVPSSVAMASTSEMKQFEGTLTMAWEQYYTSSIERAREYVEENMARLAKAFAHSEGFHRDQYDAMRCRYFQLMAQLQCDLGDFDTALRCENESIAIARRLRNISYLTAGLQRRARVHVRLQDYDLAWEQIEEALRYVDEVTDPIKGKVYQIAGEIVGHTAHGNASLQKKSMAYFDKAAQIARLGNLTPDGSFYKTDIASVYTEKAEVQISFGLYKQALETLEIARNNTPAEQNRWKVNLALIESMAYIGMKRIVPAASSLKDAYDLATGMHLIKKVQRVQELSQRLANLAPEHESVKLLQEAIA